MKKTLEILNSFITDKKNNYLSNQFLDRDYRYKKEFKTRFDGEFGNIGPFNHEEAFKYRPFENGWDEKLTVDFIPKELYNKKIKLGEFELTIQYQERSVHHGNTDKYNSWDARRIYHEIYNEWFIILNYHGCYTNLGKFRNKYTIQAWECLPTCTTWYNINPTKEKPYILEEAEMWFEFNHWDKLKELLETLDISNVKLESMDIDNQDWYFDSDNKKIKSIHTLSLEEKDIEWFIKSEVKNGIYRPEKTTIERFLFTEDKSYQRKIGNKYDKKLLSKLGIHTVQLRADSHYDVAKYFDMKDIKVKAPQKVIEKYNMEKYCIDDEVINNIKEKALKEIEKEQLKDYNNKFTLIQHGKIIKENIDKEDIIDYLENFNPSNKTLDEIVIECVKPIFEAFKSVNKFYIAYWGRYYKYESRGEKCDITYDCYYKNRVNISENTLEQIYTLYEENTQPNLDERQVEKNWGWEDRGGTIMGVERDKKGKLKVFTEDHELE